MPDPIICRLLLQLADITNVRILIVASVDVAQFDGLGHEVSSAA
jgi:hypothetical protein